MIVVQLLGGMGNQMFQYAFGKRLSTELHTPLLIDVSFLNNRVPMPNYTFREYALQCFSISPSFTSENDCYQYPRNKKINNLYFRGLHYFNIRFKNNFHYLREWKPGISASIQIPDAKRIYLDGYWQSENYFKSIREVIQDDFSIQPSSISEITLQTASKIKNANCIGVHVRRGDFLNHPTHHGVIGADYITKGIHMIQEKNPSLESIYVFSNDLKWCKENIKSNIPIVFVDDEVVGPKDHEHFYLLSLCSHFIISNSSWSWWAAWLGKNLNKTVIAPAKWLENPNINTSEVIPTDWIKL